MNLLPCPFCGGEAKVQTMPDYRFPNALLYDVTCTKCCASPTARNTPEQAATLWNQRTPKVEVALTEERQKNIAVCVKCWEPIELRNGQWQHMWINPYHAATPKENDQNQNNT